MTEVPQFILEHTNGYGERHYFMAHGLQWPYRPDRKLIEYVTSSRDEARRFSTEAEAAEALWVSGDPPGWKVVTA